MSARLTARLKNLVPVLVPGSVCTLCRGVRLYLVPASCARGVPAILVPPDTDPPWPDLAYLFLCRSLCRSLCHPCAILRCPCAEACPPEVPPRVGPSVFTSALAPATGGHKDRA